MRKEVLILSIGLITLSCKAQNVVSIYDGPWDLPPRPRYFKDVYNDHNKFVGTWKWQNGTNSWTIEFKKVVKFESKIKNETTGLYTSEYNDYLVGEYKYVSNGLERINSYPLLLGKDPYSYNIYAHTITTTNRGFPPCSECAPNTRFIIGKIKDPTRPGLLGKIRMAIFTENGIEKIRLRITYPDSDPSVIGPNYSGPKTISINSGVYTLIKQ